ncbi:MAG: GatB/YqeY domain-containing protein [Lachnospiraceae bacterium]|nr:GatB/YqeY domain-containing protein [Lachnospiraceae bacterium]
MSKIETIRAEMVTAMKNKDKERKEILSLLLAALKNVAIDKRADLTEEEENSVVLKEIKQLNDLLDQTPADRTDIIDLCKYRIGVLEEFAPKMLTEEEIKELIAEVLQELEIEIPAPSDKGKIMKELMPKVKGKADGKMVNQLVAEMFQ